MTGIIYIADNGGTPVGGYNPLPIKTTQNKYRENFTTGNIADRWDIEQGTGTSVAISGTTLIIGSGTVAGEQVSLLSKDMFQMAFRITFGLTLSQRIANQTFVVEAVSVDPITGIPDGLNTCGLIFDGTTATLAKYRVQNGGATPLDSGGVSFPSTASNSVYEIEPAPDDCWFFGGTIDSTSGRTVNYKRQSVAPDPKAMYKIRLRWVNGTISGASYTPATPASSTNATIQFITCHDYTELTTEITSGRGQTASGQSIGVQVNGGTVTASNTAGAGAHDSAIAGNPVRIAGRAVTSNYTGVASGDTADFVTTTVGAQIVRPFSIPELDWQYASAAITGVTDNPMKAAGAAGIRNYVTGIQLKNVSATVGTEVVIKDGTTTVIWRGYLPANMISADTIIFNTPLKGTAATALNFACLTTGANVYVSAQGYQAP